ncbi:MAG: hypothetical protein GY715_07870 [Planctomycetes bacterium]|nr:hypothetical protein [Planctomycetota bacterium]
MTRFAATAVLGGVLSITMAVGASAADVTPILASDGGAGDQYGNAIAVDGTFAVVGASHVNGVGADAGSAYVRRRLGATWIEDAKLAALDAAEGDEFGASVAISGTWIVVGAPKDDDHGSGSGSAYVFHRNGLEWTQFTKLTAPDAAGGDAFGGSVAIDGNTLVVGARRDDDLGSSSGSVHVFAFDGQIWRHQQKLLATGGGASNFFGKATAISGNVIVAGAYGFDGATENTGAAYVFRRHGDTWSQERQLEAPDAAWNAFFGWSVDIAGEYIIAGAPEDLARGPSAGAAYIFHYTGGSWMQQDKLTASNIADFDEFGLSVSVSGDVAIVGSHQHEEQYSDSGSAYVFRRIGGSWIEDAMLMPPVPFYWDEFGYAVDISGNTVVVGAVQDDDLGNNSGAAFVTDLEGATPCPGDLDGSGAIDFGDVLAAIAAWGPCQGCPEDINQDGEVSFADILVVIGAWGPC